MRRQHLPLYVIALAIVVVGLAFAGVPMSTLLFGLLVLACPLMMMFMMGGTHGGGGTPSADQDHDHRPTSGRP